MRASSARHQAVLPRDGDHLLAVPAPVQVRPASQHASITSFHSCPPSILCTSLRNYFTITLGSQVEVLEGKYAAVEARIELLDEFPLPKDTEATR